MLPRIYVDSPLGPDALTLRHMTGYEELGRLSQYELQLLSVVPDLDSSELLGQDMTVSIDLPNHQLRHFHGCVSDVMAVGRSGRMGVYRVRLRPWFWFLTRTANCRIFQGKTVPDIIKLVFEGRGFTDFEDALTGSYRTWDYLVQYRETDYSFVSRLMEQEGLYYFFRHEQGKHTLVLADGYGAHEATPGLERIPFYRSTQGARHEREHVDSWTLSQTVQPGSYVLDDYDFKRPRASLQVTHTAPLSHQHDDFEMYDYPGEYVGTDEGENYARIRLESLHASFERVSGSANTRGLTVGALFELTDHPRDSQNAEYLVTDARYEISAGDEGVGEGGDSNWFRVSFNALKSATPFRLPATTAKPVVYGPQTAKVVGDAGSEIFTDEYGRVKVQFPWDREGHSDETSSCWVRVSQVMAGNGWGAMHVPRVGQEVVISFLEGDPDRPLITGRVYNASNMPPFPLPTKGMISGIKTDSTKGGGGYNEISLDDSKGSEKIVIHGQKDMATTIEHDQTLTVHNNRTSTVDAEDSESVGGNQTVSVTKDQKITVSANQHTKVDASHTLTVTLNSAESIGIAKELSIGGGYQVSVGAAMNETVGGLKAEEVGGLKTVKVGASSSESVVGGKSLSAKSIAEQAKEDFTVQAGKKIALSAGDDFALSGKKKGVIEIADELTIKVGKAQITMKKNGDIVLKGAKITVDGSGAVVVSGKTVGLNP